MVERYRSKRPKAKQRHTLQQQFPAYLKRDVKAADAAVISAFDLASFGLAVQRDAGNPSCSVRRAREVEWEAWQQLVYYLCGERMPPLGENRPRSERVLVRRAAMLTLQLEMLEHRWATKHHGIASTKDLEVYQRASSALRRLFESLGLNRRAKEVDDLATYLAEYEASDHSHDAESEP
jgi:hypothetical protein